VECPSDPEQKGAGKTGGVQYILDKIFFSLLTFAHPSKIPDALFTFLTQVLEISILIHTIL
jgi:hypothetical protein